VIQRGRLGDAAAIGSKSRRDGDRGRALAFGHEHPDDVGGQRSPPRGNASKRNAPPRPGRRGGRCEPPPDVAGFKQGQRIDRMHATVRAPWMATAQAHIRRACSDGGCKRRVLRSLRAAVEAEAGKRGSIALVNVDVPRPRTIRQGRPKEAPNYRHVRLRAWDALGRSACSARISAAPPVRFESFGA